MVLHGLLARLEICVFTHGGMTKLQAHAARWRDEHWASADGELWKATISQNNFKECQPDERNASRDSGR